MGKNRLEAFSDGVIAIIITIMVLEMKVSHNSSWEGLSQIWPVFLSYTLSFVFVAIYWVNHHHLLHLLKQVNGAVLWANMHLLFWLSLVPFATAWMGENHFAQAPTMLYGIVLLACAFAYNLLIKAMRGANGQENLLGTPKQKNIKANLSILFYVIAIVASYRHTTVSLIFYALVSLMWFVPDRRIERYLASEKN